MLIMASRHICNAVPGTDYRAAARMTSDIMTTILMRVSVTARSIGGRGPIAACHAPLARAPGPGPTADGRPQPGWAGPARTVSALPLTIAQGFFKSVVCS